MQSRNIHGARVEESFKVRLAPVSAAGPAVCCYTRLSKRKSRGLSCRRSSCRLRVGSRSTGLFRLGASQGAAAGRNNFVTTLTATYFSI